MSGTTTSRTLLQRVRDPGDAEAWRRFFELYAPLLEGFARAHGLGAADAEEVRDQCLAVVSRRMHGFDYQRARGGFKRWLYTIARGKVVDHLRRVRAARPEASALLALADPGPGPDELWERTWRHEHLRFCLEEARRSVPPRSFEVFELLTVEGLEVAEVCARTGLNANQVYKAKGLVLRRVREVLARLGGAPE